MLRWNYFWATSISYGLTRSISSVTPKPVENLENDLRVFKAFLQDSAKKQRKDVLLRELVRRIRDVVYEAEDIIDAFVTQAAETQSKSYFLRAFQTQVKLNGVATEIERVRAKAPLIRQENVVGFEDEAQKLIGYLTQETHQLDAISIVGMPGLGKTTLAGKVFRDPTIMCEFPIRIWVYVSQTFTRKDVFLAIMRGFTRLDNDMYRKNEQELAQLVATRLQMGKFLIVMDDVWTVWIGRNSKLVFQRAIRWCDGLPLAIVAIGGILLRKFSKSDNMSSRKEAWTKVSKNVNTYLSEDPARRMEKIITLSYDKLPYHLRACFLYLGMFPKDFEIPIWKLIRMWIAEGLVQEQYGISLEEAAENYLEDLINRSLLRVEKTRADGRAKTCRMHGMLRDFCIKEAGSERENFLQEMKRSINGFEPSIAELQKFRRLCIHSNILNFLSLKPYGPRVRSFVCFSKDEVALPTENASAIPAAFKLLRVLEANSIKFTKIPNDMYQLVQLRYLTLSTDLAILPAAFSKLWNIQTLVVDTTSRTLENQQILENGSVKTFKDKCIHYFAKDGKR
ncbi:UNVERIFIED_CONTAM: putative late blight resistance proteinR1B-16 [Sesamum angustifolium]|uniref:Late blight resistance proteinR1B-16 n=1 Tax=Sesamum angustifolium TaxID=2727405 RepID=A0AAW2LIY2_9LAMI